MSNIFKGLNENRSSWDSNMPGYQGDYGGAENWGRRNKASDENDAIDARLRQQHAQRQEYEKSGKFWLKLKDTQRHLPAGPFTGKQAANTAALELLKQQPELKGNLVITAYGPDETQDVAEAEQVDSPKFQSAVSALKQMAKQGERKTVWDPVKRVYKTVPVNTPKKEEGVAEASPETTFNVLKGLKTWQVVIMNNYYRGKYSDYSGRYYYVLASSPEEARQVVLDNADAILQDLLSMKSVTGKKILPRGSAVPITDKRIGDIKDGTEAGRMTTAGFKRMFGPQGPMMVKLSGGAVVDVQGQEQGVAEAEDVSHLHKALDRALSKEKKASPAQVQRNKERWAQRQAEKEQGNKDMKIDELAINEDWQKVNKKDKTDGMSRKAVKAYRRENPGSKLQTAVTTKPSKLKKGSKSAKRRKSFCARMKGMKKAHASAKTKRDPDSPINKALRRWNCESVEQMQELVMIAEAKIAEAKNAKQQAAIAINMKKAGKKPQGN